ncbi:MAG: hypothetical protein KDK70_21855 [Myxococcales bacterium]|nr:hypothetical protein [Myxococcales bacterium]
MKKRDLSLEEFTRMPMPEAWRKLHATKEGVALLRDCRTFNECHIKVREETGLWIEELVPVFRKLDASIAMVR